MAQERYRLTRVYQFIEGPDEDLNVRLHHDEVQGPSRLRHALTMARDMLNHRERFPCLTDVFVYLEDHPEHWMHLRDDGLERSENTDALVRELEDKVRG